MDIKKKYLLLAGILIIAAFFRLYHITTVPPGLYPDEAMNGNNALENVHTGAVKVFYPENNGREGLYIDILTAFIKFTDIHDPWIVRLPAAIAGILSVLGLYFLIEILWNYQAALLSAFFLAVNFWNINFSRIGFRAILAPLCLMWALYFLIRAVKEEKIRPAFAAAALAGIIYGLGFYTYIAYRITPLLLLLFIPFFRKMPNFWKTIAVFLAATIITGLPIGIYFLKNPGDFLGRTTQVSIFSSGNPAAVLALNTIKTLGMFNFHGDWNWRHNFAGAPELYFPVGILFLSGLFLSLHFLWRWFKKRDWMDNRAFGEILMLLWFVLAMAPVAASNEGIPHALRSILMGPPAFVWAATGTLAAYALLKKYFSRFWLAGIAVFFIALCVAQAYSSYFIAWAKNPNVPGAFAADYVEIGRAINALPPGVPKYVIVEAGGVDVRGVPMPAQTVMFVTDTFRPQEQQAKNVYYVLPQDESRIASSAVKFYIK